MVASNLAHDSAKQNLASTFVNAFVNAGFQTDRLMTDANRTWLYKNKDHGKMSAAASLGMIYLGDVDEGPGKIDPFTSIEDEYIPGGAFLGVGMPSLSLSLSLSPFVTCTLANSYRLVD
jgi:26S proteasome regulatory subunit N1